MTRLVLPVFVVLVGLITLNVARGEAANSSGPSLVPWPKTLRPVQGALAITERSRLVVTEKTLAPLAAILSEEIFTVTGVRLATGDGKPGKGDIALVLDPSLKGEHYELTVADTAVVAGADGPQAAARLPVNWVSDAAAAVAFGVQGFHVFGHRGLLPPERGLLGDDSWKTPAVV